MAKLAVDTFIKVMEVWVPSADGRRLEIESASYQDLEGFETASHDLYFAKGEGLPGLVWQAKRPIVLEDFSGPIFVRKQAAEAAGLAAGIGIPIFDQDILTAVVVLLCGDPASCAGALEVWSRDVTLQELCLSSGYYGSLKNLRYISHRIRFGKGVGLPGQVWQKKLPVMMDKLAHTKSFIRAHTARAEVLTTGLGIPVISHGRLDHVVVLLSALDTPLARVFEIWKPQDGHLVLAAGAYGEYEDVACLLTHKTLGEGDGFVAQAWKDRKPIIVTGNAWQHGTQKAFDGLKTGIAIPVGDGDEVRAVVVLFM